MVLRRYASISTSSSAGPRSGPKPWLDGGRIAAVASRSEKLGELIVCVCDAYDVALTDLGRRSGMDSARIGSVCRGDRPSPEESYRLRNALEEIVRNVCP